MKATLAPTSVADFCQDLIASKITVNRDYQRDDRVWSSYIKSYFIESILLEYPIPKIFLYVRYNLKSRTSIKEIVDGQQRSQALRLFYENRLRISTKIETEELRGKRYKDLDERLQGVFLSYSLAIDEFSGVNEDEIRESFARMNVHNASLNSEELRNARFQGPFKLFIFRMAKVFREAMIEAGIISRRDVIRMADTRLLSDVVHIMKCGFLTTRPPDIDALYRQYDTSFPEESEMEDIIVSAFKYWYENKLSQYTRLNSKHVFYTLINAIIEKKKNGYIIGQLSNEQLSIYQSIYDQDVDLEALDFSLMKVSAEEEDDGFVKEQKTEGPYENFVSACSQKTNVNTQKLIRFSYLSAALKNHESTVS